MGIRNEASRLLGVLSRSQPLRAFNRPENTLHICVGVLGVLGTIAVLASLRYRDSLPAGSTTSEDKVRPLSSNSADKVDSDMSIEPITTPPPAYEREYIDSASSARMEELPEAVEDVEQEVAASPSSRSRFRKRIKKTFKFGRKNSAQQ